MKNKVYYGEYSLKHWIELILKGKITLPDYQRRFVWFEQNVKDLMKTFNDNLFVPPVTIGAFTIDGKSENLILDGQQRLTSILLAYLGKYPNKARWEVAREQSADENDDEADSEQPNKELKWKFKELTRLGKKKEDILNSIEAEHSDSYDTLTLTTTIDDKFLNEKFLGFSYLVPAKTKDKNVQQEYYSTTFRSINSKGTALSSQESRAALYFLEDSKTDFLNAKICNSYITGNEPLDWVRYLALLSQYYKDVGEWNIAAGFGNKIRRETYYENYIYSVVGKKPSTTFADFSSIFPTDNYIERFDVLRQTLRELNFDRQFSSIINMDIYFFGLIYEVVFEGKTIDVSRKEELKTELNAASQTFRDEWSHARAPAALKYLRPRIAKSIEIYRKYVEEPS